MKCFPGVEATGFYSSYKTIKLWYQKQDLILHNTGNTTRLGSSNGSWPGVALCVFCVSVEKCTTRGEDEFVLRALQ